MRVFWLLASAALFSQSPTLTEARRITIAAYYYPWHGTDFHRNSGYLRQVIGQEPELGEYNDQDPEVILQHMAMSEKANIEVWVSSWWGPQSREDDTLLGTILPTLYGKRQKVALFYESTDRIGKVNQTSTVRVVDDINHMCDFYFNSPSYYTIDGRPVLFMYLTRRLQQDGILAEVLLMMRATAAKRGYSLYIVGDHTHGSPPTTNLKIFDYVDAVTNYDVRGGIADGLEDLYAGEERVEEYFQEQAEWQVRAREQSCAYIPGITPGFNDRGVRLEVDRAPLSRKLTRGSDEGTLFAAQLDQAVKLIDPAADFLLVVNSFNEWHEDTQIEPVGVSDVNGRLTADEIETYTVGLEYEVYGDLYLDLLGAAAITDSGGVISTPDEFTNNMPDWLQSRSSNSP